MKRSQTSCQADFIFSSTGTTFLGQIVTLLLVEESKYEEYKAIPVYDRLLYMEMTYPGQERPQLDKIDTIPSPRPLKTHLPFRFINR